MTFAFGHPLETVDCLRRPKTESGQGVHGGASEAYCCTPQGTPTPQNAEISIFR
jgi:hypothetical protein